LFFPLWKAFSEALDRPARENPKLKKLFKPVPVIIIARLAVDETVQGHGIGKALVRDALLRVVDAAKIIGGRAVLVYAKDAEAKRFYEQRGFDSFPSISCVCLANKGGQG
jgi:GNAT superfamily N-acetyltransferase